MVSVEIVRTLIDYHVATNRRLWGGICWYLTDEQFTRDLGYSWGSIRSQMAHMINVDRWRTDNILERVDRPRLKAEDYPTRDSFTPTFEEAEQALLDAVSPLTEDQLSHTPASFKETIWQLLMQVVNHGTDHRAQMLGMLHQMDVPTFPQDFIFYLWSLQTMTRDEVLAKINTGYAEWDAAISAVPHARMTDPFLGDWSLRDVIAHMTWGEAEMLRLIQTRSMAGASDLWNLPQDERNRRMVDASRSKSLDEVLGEAAQVHHDLVAEIEKLEDADLNEASRFVEMPADWKLWKLLEGNTWGHYGEHIDAVRDWHRSLR